MSVFEYLPQLTQTSILPADAFSPFPFFHRHAKNE